MAQCLGKTKDGKKCRKSRIDGQKYCKLHLDQLNELSQVEESFCYHYVFTCKSAFEAWKKAHPDSEAKDESIYSHASRTLKKVKIKSRIASLRAELASERIWTRHDSIRVLTEVAEDDTKSSNSSRVSAVNELNKLHGYNEPDRLDITTGGDKLESNIIATIDPIEAAKIYADIMRGDK